jgi:molybdate transport system substrate-binding protein
VRRRAQPGGVPARGAGATLGALVLAACGAGSAPASPPAGAATGAPTGTVTVFAAASLTDVFATLGRRFEAAYQDTTVQFNFGSSSALGRSILQGAPADVFASASPSTMDEVTAGGAAADPTVFARNEMALAVPPENPAGVRALADLARPGVKVALCQPQVPCGEAAGEVLANAGVPVQPVSLEVDVRATLTKVSLGEVDAGIVYVTDVAAADGAVTGIPVPAGDNVSTDYPVAALTDAPNAVAAQAFVDYVLSDEAAGVLAAAGFETP